MFLFSASPLFINITLLKSFSAFHKEVMKISEFNDSALGSKTSIPNDQQYITPAALRSWDPVL